MWPLTCSPVFLLLTAKCVTRHAYRLQPRPHFIQPSSNNVSFPRSKGSLINTSGLSSSSLLYVRTRRVLSCNLCHLLPGPLSRSLDLQNPDTIHPLEHPVRSLALSAWTVPTFHHGLVTSSHRPSRSSGRCVGLQGFDPPTSGKYESRRDRRLHSSHFRSGQWSSGPFQSGPGPVTASFETPSPASFPCFLPSAIVVSHLVPSVTHRLRHQPGRELLTEAWPDQRHNFSPYD